MNRQQDERVTSLAVGRLVIVLLAVLLTLPGWLAATASAEPSAGRCATEIGTATSVIASMNAHAAKPHVFKLPEQQAQATAYDAEAARLKVARDAAKAALVLCVHNTRDTSRGRTCQAGDSDTDCRGPVAVCGTQDKAANGFPGPDELPGVTKFVSIANQENVTRGPFKRHELTPAEQSAKTKAAADERTRNPGSYPDASVVASHIPDVTWSGNPAGPFMPMARGLNTSIGTQAYTYPVGYVATSFEIGQWQGSRCTIPKKP